MINFEQFVEAKIESKDTKAEDKQWMKEILEEGKKKWIKDAIKHPGRCTPAPNPDCPKGSPQYNLAMRFKKGDLHKKKKKD